MTNDNTRSKANAVFFSLIMVLSMVGVGFAAGPAAAANQGSVTFNDQQLDDGSVDVDVSGLAGGSTPNEVTAVVTYTNSAGNPVAAGATTTNVGSASGTVSVSIGDAGGFPGSHTAHLFNPDDLSASGVPIGSELASSTVNDRFAFDSAFVQRSDREGKEIVNGSTIYQGEDDLVFLRANNNTVSPAALQKTAGNDEGTSLNLPIGEDAATGSYATDDGFSVVVQEPRITTSEVQLPSGNDIEEVSTSNADSLTINAEWNFADAEDIEVTVEDPSGADITNVVTNSDTIGSSPGSVGLDLSEEDA
ncbi:MAG: hypothetical protein A07HR67_01138, partial [uncultured archaeon A07HR67]